MVVIPRESQPVRRPIRPGSTIDKRDDGGKGGRGGYDRKSPVRLSRVSASIGSERSKTTVNQASKEVRHAPRSVVSCRTHGGFCVKRANHRHGRQIDEIEEKAVSTYAKNSWEIRLFSDHFLPRTIIFAKKAQKHHQNWMEQLPHFRDGTLHAIAIRHDTLFLADKHKHTCGGCPCKRNHLSCPGSIP